MGQTAGAAPLGNLAEYPPSVQTAPLVTATPRPKPSMAPVGQGTAAIPAPLVERVVGLLTAMGYRARASRTLVHRAIAGPALPSDRPPTTEELLRASLRAAG